MKQRERDHSNNKRSERERDGDELRKGRFVEIGWSISRESKGL